jgi:hypothetical protein
MQGKRQEMRHLGIKQGELAFANCLHKPRKDLKAESATITSAFPKRRAVAAPILRPQITIL